MRVWVIGVRFRAGELLGFCKGLEGVLFLFEGCVCVHRGGGVRRFAGASFFWICCAGLYFFAGLRLVPYSVL